MLHNKFPGFSGFGFCKKLGHTKNQHGTEKESEHNGSSFSGYCLPKLSISKAICPERANCSVLMDTGTLEDPYWSNYALKIIHNVLI